jgi:hypothetical protein
MGPAVARFWCQIQAVRTMSSSWVYFGFQPSSRIAFSELATSTAGSPGRRGCTSAGIAMPGHAPRRFNHLAHAESLPVAQVEVSAAALAARSVSSARAPANAPPPGRKRGCSRGCMCRRALVVVAIDADRRAPSQRHVQNQRNQVRFRLMRLAARHAVRPFRRSGHVEVAQTKRIAVRECAASTPACAPPAASIHRTRWWASGAHLR